MAKGGRLDGVTTRIPKDLLPRPKLHCVTHDILLQHFVKDAIEKRLGRKLGPKKRTR